MRRRIALLTLLFITSCGISVQYIPMGKEYPPHQGDVDLILSGRPQYHVKRIGLITLTGGNLKSQLTKVKEIARQKGGDVIILIESKTLVTNAGGGIASSEQRTFELAKMID